MAKDNFMFQFYDNKVYSDLEIHTYSMVSIHHEKRKALSSNFSETMSSANW